MSSSATDYVVDKTTWGDGPWQHEPDRVDFVFAGFACFARRRENLGHWCGYVGVPREHPGYGKGYDDLDVSVHGGLTYANRFDGAICHVPAPGMPDDVWWLGFDCAHAGDLAPGARAREREMGLPPIEEMIDTPAAWRDKYRDLAYVRSEIEHLAVQLAAMMPAPVIAPAGAA